MKKRFALLLSIVLLLVCPLFARGEIYQWTDDNGNEVFSDTLPPGKKAKIKKLNDEGVYTSRPQARSADSEMKNETGAAASAADQEIVEKRKRHIRDVNVIMYMTNWCTYCKKAREYINSLGASLTEYNIDEDKNRKDEMLKKSGSTGVPVIDVDGIIVRGYNPVIIKQAIEKRAN